LSIKIEVIRNSRRRKTCSAQLKDDVIIVRIPRRMSQEQEKKAVKELTERILKRQHREKLNREHSLTDRARSLCRKYLGVDPPVESVQFVTNQNSCFGSCSVGTGKIRISHRLENAPGWVLDYVLIHEMAHLVHGNHSRAFYQLLDKYPMAERARGFLIALSFIPDDSNDILV